MKTSATTVPAIDGAELLKICHYDDTLVAIIISSHDNWRELLDSIQGGPDLRRGVTSLTQRIRAALGKDHEL
jgi:hypothetical protein